ncbi:MAG: GYF domain-containing protein [Bacteroidales bacterium]|nr:GYF domain-containing protein [Bacteroidales bacterium]
MSYYFVNTENKQEGPFLPEELTAHGVNANSFVWREGLTEWVKASDLPELEPYLNSGSSSGPAVPPIPPAAKAQTVEDAPVCDVPKPKSYMVSAIVGMVLGVVPMYYIGILLTLPFGVAGLIYEDRAQTAWRDKRYADMESAASKARIFSLTALFVGIGLWAVLLFILLFFVGSIAAFVPFLFDIF